jgi:hypothetical protein
MKIQESMTDLGLASTDTLDCMAKVLYPSTPLAPLGITASCCQIASSRTSSAKVKIEFSAGAWTDGTASEPLDQFAWRVGLKDPSCGYDAG